MITEGQKIKFILELIRRTAKSEIIWEITNSPNNFPSMIGLSYKTMLLEGKTLKIFKKMAIYETIDAYEFDDYKSRYAKIRLELIDENNNTLYEFPDDYSLMTLYRIIQEKTSGIADVFESMLQKN